MPVLSFKNTCFFYQRTGISQWIRVKRPLLVDSFVTIEEEKGAAVFSKQRQRWEHTFRAYARHHADGLAGPYPAVPAPLWPGAGKGGGYRSAIIMSPFLHYSPTGIGMSTPTAEAMPKFGEPSLFQVSFCILGALWPLVVLATLRA